MERRESGELSLDAIMREVREALDRAAVAPAAETKARRRLVEFLTRRIWRRA